MCGCRHLSTHTHTYTYTYTRHYTARHGTARHGTARYRFECEFSGVAEGLRFNAAVSESIIASSTFLNCVRSIVNGVPVTDGGGGGTGVINCRVTVGQRTAWALPSGDSLFVEGTSVIADAHGGRNASATVFDPCGAGSMTLMHNNFESGIPLGVSTPIACDNITCPIPWLAPPLPSDAAEWILVNNKVDAGGMGGTDAWSHAAAVVLGPSSSSTDVARVVVLADSATSMQPQSQLLFGGEW